MGSEDGKQKYWKAADARRALAEWEASGLTIAAFSQARGMSAQRLKWWRGRLGQGRPEEVSPPPLSFLPVRVRSESAGHAPHAQPAPASPFELSLGDGRTLRVPPDFNADALGRLLGVLGASRC